VLLVTTDDDRPVPPEESRRLHERAGKPKKLVVLRGYGHHEVYTEPAFGEVMRETVAWYWRHLPARAV
jgi:pimeloyl-ACP methyl ester carboxylesterase